MVIVTSFQEPESRILFQQQNTRAVLNKHDLGVGTIIVSERTLCWKEQGNTGFAIEYPHISMHAISSDRNVYPTDCIFIIIDGPLSLPNVPVEPAEDESDEEDVISELLFIPQNADSIRLIYNAMSECQVLNPDAADEVDDEEEDHEYVYEDANEFHESADEIGSDLGAGGDTEMSHLSNQLNLHSINYDEHHRTNGNGDQIIDDDQFEDAD